jgi:2-methylcitrate dehydratase
MSALTTVQRIGRFAYDARPDHLSPQSRTVFRRNILDSLGCAIAALPGVPLGHCANNSTNIVVRVPAR